MKNLSNIIPRQFFTQRYNELQIQLTFLEHRMLEKAAIIAKLNRDYSALSERTNFSYSKNVERKRKLALCGKDIGKEQKLSLDIGNKRIALSWDVRKEEINTMRNYLVYLVQHTDEVKASPDFIAQLIASGHVMRKLVDDNGVETWVAPNLLLATDCIYAGQVLSMSTPSLIDYKYKSGVAPANLWFFPTLKEAVSKVNPVEAEHMPTLTRLPEDEQAKVKEALALFGALAGCLLPLDLQTANAFSQAVAASQAVVGKASDTVVAAQESIALLKEVPALTDKMITSLDIGRGLVTPVNYIQEHDPDLWTREALVARGLVSQNQADQCNGFIDTPKTWSVELTSTPVTTDIASPGVMMWIPDLDGTTEEEQLDAEELAFAKASSDGGSFSYAHLDAIMAHDPTANAAVFNESGEALFPTVVEEPPSDVLSFGSLSCMPQLSGSVEDPVDLSLDGLFGIKTVNAPFKKVELDPVAHVSAMSDTAVEEVLSACSEAATKLIAAAGEASVELTSTPLYDPMVAKAVTASGQASVEAFVTAWGEAITEAIPAATLPMNTDFAEAVINANAEDVINLQDDAVDDPFNLRGAVIVPDQTPIEITITRHDKKPE